MGGEYQVMYRHGKTYAHMHTIQNHLPPPPLEALEAFTALAPPKRAPTAHCKCFSRNLSGFYSCPCISCTPVVVLTTVSWTQLIDVMHLQYIY